MTRSLWKRIRGPRSWFIAAVVVVVAVGVFWVSQRAILLRLYPFEYREQIVAYATRNGLDPLFVASIIKNESRFKPTAVSKKGAVGLMQIMPETGRWAAKQMGFANFDPEMLRDPATNIMIGTWYLAELRREFGGRLVLVVAAYNCGRGNVRDWVTAKGLSLSPSLSSEAALWPGEEITEDFPVAEIKIQETRNYVRGVLATLKRYRELYKDTVTAYNP